ncbi:hypothetical protein B484DRAFT_297302, partial [Ochromonadaceae sp. CCMP2298]
FVDLDNDGDLDLMATESGGEYHYYENIGSSSSPAFGAVQTNPFGLAINGDAYSWGVSFADLDNDGDQDMIAGTQTGNYYYYENTGTVSSPTFGTKQSNPFSLTSTSANYSYPQFVDMDSDGDFDILAGDISNGFYYYENIGTLFSPNFNTVVTNPYGLAAVTGNYTTPGIADIDGDGDLDILSGTNANANFYYYENTAGTACSVEMSQTATVTVNLPNYALTFDGIDDVVNVGD